MLIFAIFYLLLNFEQIFCISGGINAKELAASSGVVLIDNDLGRGTPPYCMGALVNEQFVLTNGFCCDSNDDGKTFIHIGSTTPLEESQIFQRVNFRVLGTAHLVHYKLCVIKLDRAVQFGPNVLPLKIPEVFDNIKNKENPLDAFGYGSTVLDDKSNQYDDMGFQRWLSPTLQAIDISLLDKSLCDSAYGKVYTGASELHCVGYPKDRKKRLMLDDSGAPVVGSKDRVLYGLAVTYAPLKSGINWHKDAFPIHMIDMLSFRNATLLAMKEMCEKLDGPS